jgi:hypothetical protein
MSNGRRVVVTAGAAGIGLAIAKAFGPSVTVIMSSLGGRFGYPDRRIPLTGVHVLH